MYGGPARWHTDCLLHCSMFYSKYSIHSEYSEQLELISVGLPVENKVKNK